ncbi:MAG: tetratricopeptide repeat protein [Spirochaetota bacterium]
MVCQSRIRRFNRSAGLVVLLVGLVWSAGAQIRTELSDQAIAVGERVSYVITIRHEEPEDVEVRPPDFPGLRLVEGPSVRPISILGPEERVRSIEVRFVLEAVAAGRYVLPEIPVNVAGQPYLTDARLIEIGERTNRNSVPYLARWTGAGRPVHHGEARVYELEIYNATEYLYPSSVTVRPPQNAILEEVQGLGTIEQYTVDGVTLYAIPVAVFMVTASEPGTLELPEATIATPSLSAVAPRKEVPVESLPPAAEPTGAVGSFVYEAAIEPATILPSETAQLRLRVSGSGNLHFLAIPEPELTGFQIEHDDTTSSYSPTESGYEGYRERVLTLRPTGGGRHAIDVGEFAYFEPVSGRVMRSRPPNPEPHVLTMDGALQGSSAEFATAMLGASEIAAMERRTWYDDPLAYGWFVPGLLFLVALRVWKRGSSAMLLLLACGSFMLTDSISERLPWDDIDRGLRRYEEGNLDAAVSAFERAARQAPDSPGINHNLGVLYFHLGDLPRAVFAIREAIRLAPMASAPRSLLGTVEASAGIDRSVPPPHLVHPDLLFFALAVLVNGLFVGIALAHGRKRGWLTIAGILVIVISLGVLAGLVRSAVEHEEQLGVVRGEVTLQRIPGDDADGWLPVRSGSAVHVVSRQDEFLLVRTSLGLEGWVRVEDLLWPENPANDVLRYRGYAL